MCVCVCEGKKGVREKTREPWEEEGGENEERSPVESSEKAFSSETTKEDGANMRRDVCVRRGIPKRRG